MIYLPLLLWASISSSAYSSIYISKSPVWFFGEELHSSFLSSYFFYSMHKWEKALFFIYFQLFPSFQQLESMLQLILTYPTAKSYLFGRQLYLFVWLLRKPNKKSLEGLFLWWLPKIIVQHLGVSFWTSYNTLNNEKA